MKHTFSFFLKIFNRKFLWIKIFSLKKTAVNLFEGVYLDGLDTFSYFQRRGKVFADRDMISLVADLRGLSQSINRDFLQFSNNGVELYRSVEFVGLIDGMVAEDVWYQDDVVLDEKRTNFTLQFLRQGRIDGKTILAADFPRNSKNVCDFYVKCTTEVFRCAVFDSLLNGSGRSCLWRMSKENSAEFCGPCHLGKKHGHRVEKRTGKKNFYGKKQEKTRENRVNSPCLFQVVGFEFRNFPFHIRSGLFFLL